jgi:RND family efflux transporter MFP subunit
MFNAIVNSDRRPGTSTRMVLQALFGIALVALSVPAAYADLPLATAPVSLEVIATERLFDGTVEAVHQATISAQTAGRVAQVNYDVDDFVEHGSVLIRFTDVEQRTALRETEARLAEAHARALEADSEYQRARNLKERNLGSQRDLDRALAGRDSAAAQVASAESAVERARQQLDYTMVKAPYSGIVTERFVEIGESVSNGQRLMSGLSLERLRVTLDLPQQVSIKVRPDPRAVILTGEGPVKPEKITVFPVADPLTNTFRVRLELPAGQFGLYPGMFVKVAFRMGDAERLLVPAAALVRRSEVTGVYVVVDGGIRLRQIRVGEAVGDRVEVLAGLTEGERVALDPVQAGIYAKRPTVQQP